MSWGQIPSLHSRSPLTVHSLPYRRDRSVHTEAKSTETYSPLRRVRRALVVLLSHKMWGVNGLVHANGSWLSFPELPLAIRSDARWTSADFDAITSAIHYSLPQKARSQISASRQPHLDSFLVKMQVNWEIGPVTSPADRTVADPFAWISHVSEYLPADRSYLCHYRPMQHASDYLPPAGWQCDEALARYLCGSASILRILPQGSTVYVDFVCKTTRVTNEGTVFLVGAPSDEQELLLPVSGYRGLRSKLRASPLAE